MVDDHIKWNIVASLVVNGWWSLWCLRLLVLLLFIPSAFQVTLWTHVDVSFTYVFIYRLLFISYVFTTRPLRITYTHWIGSNDWHPSLNISFISVCLSVRINPTLNASIEYLTPCLWIFRATLPPLSFVLASSPPPPFLALTRKLYYFNNDLLWWYRLKWISLGSLFLIFPFPCLLNSPFFSQVSKYHINHYSLISIKILEWSQNIPAYNIFKF